MKLSIELKRKWIPFALIPMMSLAVLTGCSSNDDSGNDNDNTEMDGGADGADGSGDGADGSDGSGDGSGGGDGSDGSDGADGGGSDGGDNDGSDGGDGSNGGDGGGEIMPPAEPIGTGPLGEGNVGFEGDIGTVNFRWDGFNLNGTVTTNPDQAASSAALYKGIAASSDPGQMMIALSGTGENGGGPNFEYPRSLSADQSSPIAAEIASGNLFVRVQTANGPVDSYQLLPPSNAARATFTTLVPVTEGSTSTGGAYMNINEISGDYSIFLNVNIADDDLDENGNKVTMNAAHIHSGSAGGDILVTLENIGSGTEFRATGTMNADSLAVIKAGDGWFNVHLNDGSTPGASYFTGEIPNDQFSQ